MTAASIHAELQAQARQTAVRTIKERARAYILQPWQLDMLRLGFDASRFTPEQLIAFGKEILREAQLAPQRLALVPVLKLNAKAVILVGRYRLRRIRKWEVFLRHLTLRTAGFSDNPKRPA